jgi:hypothetical protein
MLEGDAVPAGVLPALGQAFWQFHQEELLAPYADQFVRWVAAASLKIPGATLRRVVQLAFPLTGVDDCLLTEVEELAHREAVPPAVAGALLDQADRSRRALRARTRPDDFAMPPPVM